jgi:hypothetical protein
MSTITGRPRKYPAQEIARLYATGISAAEVGRQLGIAHTTVTYALDQLGIRRRQDSGRRCGSMTPRADSNWVDYSAYRKEWRAERQMGPVARMMAIVSRRKPRLAL